jgi:predicted porin
LQAVFGRKFSNAFSLQISPTYLHINRTTINDANDIFALGTGARYKLSKRLAVVADYYYVFNGLPENLLHNPLSIGLDVFTGGHVFQLHFSNTNGMNERAFIAETIYGWDNWDIMFGFNLSRVFTLGKKRNASNW